MIVSAISTAEVKSILIVPPYDCGAMAAFPEKLELEITTVSAYSIRRQPPSAKAECCPCANAAHRKILSK